MKQLKIAIISVFCVSVSVNLYSIEADVWVYEIGTNKIMDAEPLFKEAMIIGQETGQNVGIGIQQIGKGGDLVVRWYDFYESPTKRAATKYTSPKWDKFIEKFWASKVIKRNPRNYHMTLIDDEMCNSPATVQVWVWKPKKGKFNEAIESFKQSKILFEAHGFEIDMWQEGLGGQDNLQFVMCSESPEAEAKSIESLFNSEEWKAGQPLSPLYNSDNENSKLIGSFQMFPLQLD